MSHDETPLSTIATLYATNPYQTELAISSISKWRAMRKLGAPGGWTQLARRAAVGVILDREPDMAVEKVAALAGVTTNLVLKMLDERRIAQRDRQHNTVREFNNSLERLSRKYAETNDVRTKAVVE